MNVSILTTSFPLHKGDIAGTFVLEQARHLMKQGINVQVIAPHNALAPRNEVMDGIPVQRFRYLYPEYLQTLCYRNGIPENMKKSIWAKAQLPALTLSFIFQAIRYGRHSDIIHAHWPIAGLAGLVARKLRSIPFVMNLHHGNARSMSKIEKIIIEQADYLICNSTFTLENVLQTLTPRAYRVIPPGIHIDRFKPLTKESCRENLQHLIPPDRSLIFSLGRLIEWKGHRYLIDALGLMKPELNIHLTIGGEGYLRKKLETYAHSKGLSERVTFLGAVPYHLTPVWYSAADVYVQPSIIDSGGNTEGLGMTPMEALACETPCVGTRVGGIPDVIKDGESGFLVNPEDPAALADRITTLLQNKDLIKKMGRRGRQIVRENFSWEAKARELGVVYQSLMHP